VTGIEFRLAERGHRQRHPGDIIEQLVKFGFRHADLVAHAFDVFAALDDRPAGARQAGRQQKLLDVGRH